MEKTVTVSYEEFQALKEDRDIRLESVKKELQETRKKLEAIASGGSVIINETYGSFYSKNEMLLTNNETMARVKGLLDEIQRLTIEKSKAYDSLNSLKRIPLFDRIFNWSKII